MSRLLLGGLLLTAGIAGLNAAPCPIASLAAYIELGSTGCTVGPSPTFTFSDFQFSAIGQGSTLTADQIGVSPLQSQPGGFPALGAAFSSSGFQVTSGQNVEYLISYLVDPPPPEIIRFSMDFTDPTTGSAFSNITTTLCIDPDCPRKAMLSIFENLPTPSGPATKLSDTVGIDPFTVFLQVKNDIILNASNGGSANFTGFENRVGIADTAPVPEPASISWVGAALVVLSIARRLRSTNKAIPSS